MAEQRLLRVELTASFLERLASIDAFLTEAGAAFVDDELLAQLPLGAAEALRVYLHGDYLILYTATTVYLLSIRHHRQLSFDFARLWPT